MDLYHFLDDEKGQIAIYDAVNPVAEGRRQLANEFAKHDIQVRTNIICDMIAIHLQVRRSLSSPMSMTTVLLKKM